MRGDAAARLPPVGGPYVPGCRLRPGSGVRRVTLAWDHGTGRGTPRGVGSERRPDRHRRDVRLPARHDAVGPVRHPARRGAADRHRAGAGRGAGVRGRRGADRAARRGQRPVRGGQRGRRVRGAGDHEDERDRGDRRGQPARRRRARRGQPRPARRRGEERPVLPAGPVELRLVHDRRQPVHERGRAVLREVRRDHGLRARPRGRAGRRRAAQDRSPDREGRRGLRPDEAVHRQRGHARRDHQG